MAREILQGDPRTPPEPRGQRTGKKSRGREAPHQSRPGEQSIKKKKKDL